MGKQYYILRTHSHTDCQRLWKVMSRPIGDLATAEAWKLICEKEETNAKHKFFIMEMVNETA